MVSRDLDLEADSAFRKTDASFKIDRISVVDRFEPEAVRE